jgi:hypothetical protein
MNVPGVRFERKVLIRFLSLEVNVGPRNPFIFSFELYPELAACMLELFDKGSESGLSAHPRLIHYSWKKHMD